MYPQGVCRIRKPAYAGNGCAIFLVFQTEEVGQKDGCGSQTQLRGVALKRYHICFIAIFPDQAKQVIGSHPDGSGIVIGMDTDFSALEGHIHVADIPGHPPHYPPHPRSSCSFAAWR